MESTEMKVYTCDFEGHYPVGACGVVVAETPRKAFNLMNKALVADGLKPLESIDELNELDTTKPKATILLNGEY